MPLCVAVLARPSTAGGSAACDTSEWPSRLSKLTGRGVSGTRRRPRHVVPARHAAMTTGTAKERDAIKAIEGVEANEARQAGEREGFNHITIDT